MGCGGGKSICGRTGSMHQCQFSVCVCVWSIVAARQRQNKVVCIVKHHFAAVGTGGYNTVDRWTLGMDG